MLVSLDWLNELVDISDISTKDIVNTLSLYSTEVEGVSNVLSGTNLTVGHVLTCIDHPDSDHLHICTVDVGTEVLQIVCGAPNIKADMYVIVALNNCELPGGIKIKKAKVRGVESNGMICSLGELGMEKKYVPAEYSEGIYYFTIPCKAGDNPLKLLYFSKEVLELGLTPNRSDLLSMLGVAYEVSAVFNRPLKPLAYELKELGDNNSDNITVKLETEKCITYYAKVIKNVKIKKSPDWLISRLIAFGIRPINNAVDITNYILALFGQPLHAFDKALLGNLIVVRQAHENETIITLDGITRELKTTDIVITNGVSPVALAGIMGGVNSGINDNTKDIVIEAAVFDPISIRKTYTRLDLRSESSTRFEKGVDVNRIKLALDYTCFLFETLCDATICKGDVYAGLKEVKPVEVKITSAEISNHLGVDISKIEVMKILNRLAFNYIEEKDNNLTIIVPTRRMDVAIKADIVEEVGRIHGYENLPITLPEVALAGGLTNYQKRRRLFKHILADAGLIEAVNYSLKENNNEFKYLQNESEYDIKLMLPISNERKVLRRELTSSIISNISYCYNRKIKNCGYFEIGKVYSYRLNDNNESIYSENEHLSIAISNQFSSTLWKGEKEVADFYLLKGLLTNALKPFGIELEYVKLESEFKEMHPLRTATLKLNGKVVGFMGEIHPKYSQDHDLDSVYVCELILSDILDTNYNEKEKVYTPVSKVPSVERDIALVVKKEVSAGSLVKTIKMVDKKLISDVIIFDVYQGDKVGKDEKSIAIKVVFTSPETLTDEIINSKVNKILKNLEREHNAVLRA